MEDLKNVWNVELDILKKFDSFCKKHGLSYFADSETLLGAVRHKGFIPWDDDLDFVMFRKDYDKFIKLAKKEFKYPYFIQTGYNDAGYVGGLCHIRNSETSAMLKRNWPHTKYNQGIFIDVFPLDGVIENRVFKKTQDFLKKFLFSILWNKYYPKTWKMDFWKRVFLIPLTFFPQKMLFSLYETVCKIGNILPHSKVCEISYFGTNAERKISDYEKTVFLEFEDTKVPVPERFHEILVSMYGSDYMTPKKVSSDHGETFFDVGNSYKKYLSGELALPETFIKQ